MGKRKRRRFTPQQKAQAVEIATTSGKSLTEVARDLDLTPSVLGTWVRQAGIDMKKSPKGALTTSQREELALLRRDKKRLEQENAFLKDPAPSSRRRPCRRCLRRHPRGEGELPHPADVSLLRSLPQRILRLARPRTDPTGLRERGPARHHLEHLRGSMSRKANCWDNGHRELLFHAQDRTRSRRHLHHQGLRHPQDCGVDRGLLQRTTTALDARARCSGGLRAALLRQPQRGRRGLNRGVHFFGETPITSGWRSATIPRIAAPRLLRGVAHSTFQTRRFIRQAVPTWTPSTLYLYLFTRK